MDRAYELISIMNNTNRDHVVQECKKELRKVLKPYGFHFTYDSYEERWQITA